MQIAILGTGRVGGALGIGWSRKGHQVTYGVRDIGSEEVQKVLAQSGDGSRAVTLDQAVEGAEVVVLAIPWNAAKEVLDTVGSLDGKIVIDCINPLKADFSGLDLPPGATAAEQIAEWAPGAQVIKAFNTVSDATMVKPVYGEQQATMFFCGDDEAAKSTVADLTKELELEPVDAGPLKNACYLESLSMLYIYLAIFGGWGAECAFKMVKR
jgi:NADPH-dependent F420 reductase